MNAAKVILSSALTGLMAIGCTTETPDTILDEPSGETAVTTSKSGTDDTDLWADYNPGATIKFNNSPNLTTPASGKTYTYTVTSDLPDWTLKSVAVLDDLWAEWETVLCADVDGVWTANAGWVIITLTGDDTFTINVLENEGRTQRKARVWVTTSDERYRPTYIGIVQDPPTVQNCLDTVTI